MDLTFDTETSGLPSWDKPADAPGQPRICSLAAVLTDDDGNEVEALHQFVKPDGWDHDIHPKALETHGLTPEFLAANGIPIRELLERWIALYERADTLYAFGISFDQKMLRGELRRNGFPDRYGEKRGICVMQMVTPLCKMPPTEAMMAAGRKTFKTPKLMEAHEILLGEKMTGMHDALADVRATIRIRNHVKNLKG